MYFSLPLWLYPSNPATRSTEAKRMFVLPASLASAGLALQRQSEGWLGWDGTRAFPLWWSFP